MQTVAYDELPTLIMPKNDNDELILKSWCYGNNKRVVVSFVNSELLARVYLANGLLDGTIESHDIKLDMHFPNEYRNNILLSFCYLQHTYPILSSCTDGSYKLYINSRLLGGGWFDGLLSACFLVGGITLMIAVPGAGLFLGAPLVGAGVGGLGQALKTKENFSNDYVKHSLGGALGGTIVGGAAVIAAVAAPAIAASASSGMGMASAIAINALGGAAGQALNSKICYGEVKLEQVIVGALLGSVAGATTVLVSPSTAPVVESLEVALVNANLSQRLTSAGTTVATYYTNYMNGAAEERGQRREASSTERAQAQADEAKADARVLTATLASQNGQLAVATQQLEEKQENSVHTENETRQLREEIFELRQRGLLNRIISNNSSPSSFHSPLLFQNASSSNSQQPNFSVSDEEFDSSDDEFIPRIVRSIGSRRDSNS